MGCHSREFTLEVLGELPYRNRISSHLVAQLIEMSCDDLSRALRALDALENGEPNTSHPGYFSQGGVLAGYCHVHYRREDWAAGNLAAQHRLGQDQSTDSVVEKVADKIWNEGGNVMATLDKTIDTFAERVGKRASGDWIIYRNNVGGREYLAVHPHTKRNSAEEHALKLLLDSLTLDEG